MSCQRAWTGKHRWAYSHSSWKLIRLSRYAGLDTARIEANTCSSALGDWRTGGDQIMVHTSAVLGDTNTQHDPTRRFLYYLSLSHLSSEMMPCTLLQDLVILCTLYQALRMALSHTLPSSLFFPPLA